MTTINVWPLYICDDGNVIYYRDKDEEAKELDEAQRNALQNQQQADTTRLVGFIGRRITSTLWSKMEKNRQNSHLIIHFPTSEGVGEVSE